jgi:hypothetical protein
MMACRESKNEMIMFSEYIGGMGLWMYGLRLIHEYQRTGRHILENLAPELYCAVEIAHKKTNPNQEICKSELNK